MRPELRQKWIAAGYGPTMGSAEVVPPPPRGIRRVYHFTSAKFAKDDIVHKRLKVARISELNDPFEFLSLNFRQMSERHIIDHFKEDHDKHTGLLCFSQNWPSPVLWSHYADKHRGVPVGAEMPALQVLKELEEFVLSTKYDHWSYEEEFRYFVPLKDADEDVDRKLHFFPFDDTLTLAEVILGPYFGMPLDHAKRLVNDHCPNTVTTFPTRLARQWFAVVAEGS